jgi:hypothetical protein
MYHLLRHPSHELTTVISDKSNTYPDFLMSGYQSIASGTQRQMLIKQEEETIEFVSGLQEQGIFQQ